MLNTLLKIGEWQSEGKNEWDRFLDRPKVEYSDKKGKSIENYMLPIVFDLDKMEVLIDRNTIKEYDETDVSKLKCLNLIARNGKSFYITVDAKKIGQIYKTFFGKEGATTTNGELVEFIKKLDTNLLTDGFNDLLSKIFLLKNTFYEKVTVENAKTNALEINLKAIEEYLELSNNERLVLLTVQVKSEEHGFTSPTYFSDIPDYQKVLTTQYFGNQGSEVATESLAKSLCYASGEQTEGVKELNLSERYSLNKMFVTETKNYASGFKEKEFFKNYQISETNQEKLDYASNFILNTGGYKVRIANIDHVIVPQFMQNDDVDLELALTDIKKKSDMLFTFDVMENFTKEIESETDNIFWINFIAYESDGNFFKSTELIKDVSTFHFQDVIKTFREIDWELRQSTFLNWNSIMSEYGKNPYFNLNTVYGLIPIRKDKEKKNKALDLFKSILENRRIDQSKLFDYFCELVLCHYYERYNSYTNVHKSSKDYFSKSIRDSVFKYHAFIQVLKKLNLIDTMEELSTTDVKETSNRYDQAILVFFDRMQLNQEQQAMFYLGRMLSTVEFIQKGKNKTVIQKVNFNGMDRDDILRLRNGLLEKAKQYSSVGKVIFTDRKFGELFDYNKWGSDPMNPQEAVFFLLTGYSFGLSRKEADDLDENQEVE
jgi:CRISPR-associated protein Csh1